MTAPPDDPAAPAQPGPANPPGGSFSISPPGLAPSLIRTWVPVGVGSVLAWLAVHWHIVVEPDDSAGVAMTATAVCIAGYYALSRLVERRWPRLGGLLLSVGLVQAKPVYADPADAVRLVNTRTGEVRRVDPTT